MQSRIFVDIGNTNTKWKFGGKYFLLPTAEFKLGKLPDCSKVWVSNVSSRHFDLNNPIISFVESQEKYKTLKNAYTSPKSLGCDRWLGLIASYEISEGKSFILIDIGTAITIDAVDKNGVHQGGLIFPGLEKIRQTFTNFQLSLIRNINAIGRSTEDAWTIGTLNLLVNLINQKVKELKSLLPDASIFLTGGGYSQIQDYLKFDHDYRENLVLDGLEFFADNVG